MMQIYKTYSYNYCTSGGEMYNSLKYMCHIAKNVYNHALYILQKCYYQDGTIPSTNELNKINSDTLDTNILNSYVTKSIEKEAYSAMRKFVYGKNKGQVPKYLPSDGYFPIIIEQQAVLDRCKKDNCIKFPLSRAIKQIYFDQLDSEDRSDDISYVLLNSLKKFLIRIPKEIGKENIKRVSIVPKYDGKYLLVNVTYIEDVEEDKSKKKVA